jgi:NAD(P)-dependent dehydrogenase (short-subunit alcohol dehydrogenase family)
MTVECNLTKFNHYSFGSQATITADLSIYDLRDRTMVQLEEMVVSSFSSAKPKDDYELYLHTVMDLDPEYEIVVMERQSNNLRNHIRESCDRVARFYLKIPASKPSLDTPPDSPRGDSASSFPEYVPGLIKRDMEDFILKSPYFHSLDLVRSPSMMELSHTEPLKFSRAFQSIVDHAHMIHSFRTHLCRIIQQISHRFPRMDVLDLTLAAWTLTENILDGLHDTFSSYRLTASHQPPNLLDRCQGLNKNKKVSFSDLDFDAAEGMDIDACVGSFDLVVISTEIFSKFRASEAVIIQKIRQMMRKRAFLIAVDAPPVSLIEDRIDLGEGLLTHSASSSGSGRNFDPYQSFNSSIFLPAAESSTQYFAPGVSITIRQASDEVLTLTNSGSRESLIVVGHPSKYTSFGFGIDEFEEKYGISLNWEIWPYCELQDIPPSVASVATVVVVLTDLTSQVCTNMRDADLDSLRSLMQPGKTILWVTWDAEGNPDTAASLGLTRTLKAENPNLILQVLNFCDTCSPEADIILNRLMLLLQYRDHFHKADKLRESMLFSFEPEIHLDGRRQIVPRVLPHEPAIERLNSIRREVSKTYNSLETCLRIGSAQDNDGVARFEVQHSRDPTAGLQWEPTARCIDVEYTSLYPVSTGHCNLHLSIGLLRDSGRPVAALTPHLSSKVPALWSIDLPEHIDRKLLAEWLASMISAADVAGRASPGDVVLVEPSMVFLHAMRKILGLMGGFTLGFLTTDWEISKIDSQAKYVHPLSSGRDMMRLIPRTRPTVVNCLAEGDHLSKLILSHASHFEYRRLPQLSTGVHTQKAPRTRFALAELLHHCIVEIGTRSEVHEANFVTPVKLHGTSEPRTPFAIVDWKTERCVPVPVKALVEPRLLKRNRTYILFGMTRDFGQSICRLFIQHGARNIVVASRSKANTSANWITELNAEGANIQARQCDVTDLESVEALSRSLDDVGGIVNGAMVLDDRIFAQMDIETWARVMRPKALGSSNLDAVFDQKDLDFFIMTSSFAAIGGHAGQSNYAAANMFMNGLAANRRRRGLVGSVLNIGVIYGIGLLAREERQQVYQSLEREGYPPISERDIHHMFLEAIVAGRPVRGQIIDLTTGLARYRVNDPNPLHWHRDARFCHFTVDEEAEEDTGLQQHGGGAVGNLKELVGSADSVEAVSALLTEHLCVNLRAILQLAEGGVSADSHIIELGVDSLMAVEIRNWFYKKVGSDVPVLKILQPQSISECKSCVGLVPMLPLH